jgi:hypothetical protein
MKKEIVFKVVVLLLYLLPNLTLSQSPIKHQNVYKLYDAIVGEGNTGLYNGIIYKKRHLSSEESHEFYYSFNFVKGTIIYEGQSYYDVDIKYDVFNENIIVKLPFQETFKVVSLINDKVNEFTINNKKFVNIHTYFNKIKGSDFSTFYEVISENNKIKILKLHKKEKNEKLDREYRYEVFKDKDEYYTIVFNDIYELKNKRDFIAILPDFKNQINSFYKAQKKLKKSDNEAFLKLLAVHFNNLL